jgi:ferrous iron transport protein B
LSHSYAAKIGEATEPLFEPLGVDWRVGVGLISAFAARETFVSSLAVLFNVAETDDDNTLREGLISKMREAHFADGRPIFTLASIAALLVFFMIALQCISTFATARQEMKSLRFAVVQLVVMNLVAYFVAALTYSVIS